MKVESLARFSDTPATPLVAGIPTLPSRSGWEARVVLLNAWSNPTTLVLSRLDGESEFVVDGQFVGSLPIFFNGRGARFCATTKAAPLVQRALAARLESIGQTSR